MNYRKHGLKALGVSFLAVLGLMAFAAAGAQGSGKVLVSGLSAPFTVGITGEADGLTTNDRLWILGTNSELSCSAMSVSGLLTSAGHGSATIKSESCTAQGVNAAGALVGASCAPNPSSYSSNVLALVILHSGSSALTTGQHGSGTGSPYVLFTPIDGLTFALVTNTNEECLLSEHATIKGCVVAKLSTSGDQVTHLIDTRGTASLFGCTLKYGNNLMHLEVDGLLKLTNSVHGNHAGLTWGVE